MNIPENEKIKIKEKASFLLQKGFNFKDDEFLEYEKGNIKISVAYSFQEAIVNIFFQEPYSCFSVGWMLIYMKNEEYEAFLKTKKNKVEIVLKELSYLELYFDKLTDYDFCKKTRDENMPPLPDVDLDSLDL